MNTEMRREAYELDASFRQTKYAIHLRDNPRWSRYRPDGISNNTWRETLHADSDGLDHSRLTIHLTDLFLRRDTDNSARLSEEDKELLYLAATVQNWGKSYDDEHSQGKDISYEYITSSDVEHRQRKLHVLFDELMPELDVKRRYIIEKTIYDKTTRLGEVFDSIRRLNCLRTAIIAYKEYEKNPELPAASNLGALSLGVLSNQLTYLITYAEKYTPVSEALEDSRAYIEKIFDDKTIRTHPFVAPQQTAEAAERAEIIWNRSHGEKSSIASENKRPKDDTLFSHNASFERRYINDKEQLRVVIESLKSLGLKITLTSGSFDLIHIGHAKYLERASEHGDILVVGVDSDAKIKKRKGESRPIVGEGERLRLLSHIRGVDLLTLKEPDEDKWELIKLVRPDVLIVTAETYSPEDIKELERLYCKRVVVLEPQATTSTGAQIRRIQLGEHQQISGAIQEVLAEPGLSDETKHALGRVVLKLKGE